MTKFIIPAIILILAAITSRLIRSDRSHIKKIWGLIGLEFALLVAWVSCEFLGMRAPVNPIQIASDLWKTLWKG